MRRVPLPGLGFATSALGFGCASLGSRVSPKAGLAGLARAFDAGITWFDLAPAYGGGEAETIFANFARGRRDSLQILTKVGLAPPNRSPVVRALLPVLRPLANVARTVRGGRGLQSNIALPLTPSLIETSVARSLTRLGVDAVDVLALHDPDPAGVVHDDILLTLERVLARGQARAVGIAGSRDACLAGTGAGLPFRVFQTAWAGGEPLPTIRRQAGRPVTTIGHSVIHSQGGTSSAADRLRDALVANAGGVTLVSAFDAGHLADNLAAARDAERRIPSLERAS